MAKFLPPLAILQLFDDLGAVLNGGKVFTYVAGTTTPKPTWTEASGATANTNPVILDAAGRAEIWLTEGEAYKFVIQTAAGVTLETVDNITTGEVGGEAAEEIDVTFSFLGTPGAQGHMGTYPVTRAVTFPVDFAGARGHAGTSPGAAFTMTVRRNGIEAGSIEISTAGVFTFATTGGATVPCLAGDHLTLTAPDSVGTAASIAVTLVGAVE